MASPNHQQNFVSLGRYGAKFAPFTTSVTGTDTDAVLTPTTGMKFRLKGFMINATVTTVLAGTGVALFLCDMASADTTFGASKIIMPIGTFAANAAAGTVIRNDVEPVFIPRYNSSNKTMGFISAAANNQIKISANATLSTGAIQVSGIFFYDEQA